MNKKIKHIIAATIVISTFTTIIPKKYVNLGIVKAYASSCISENEFTDMVVRKGEGEKELQFYNSSNFNDNDKVNFKFNNKTYYIKILDDTHSVNVSVDIDNDYEAYVFKENSEKAYDIEQEVPVGLGITNLYVRIYKAGEFDQNDVQDNVIKTYKICVKNIYDYNENNDFQTNIKSNINLDAGKSIIQNNDNRKYNQWICINGIWQYIDFDGNPIKNQWHNDKASGKWYYLDENGYMKTGWIKYGDSWYYLNENGVMQIGWLLFKDDWYYLNSNGTLFTGWLQNKSDWYFFSKSTGIMKKSAWIVDNEKYYYFTSSGKMLTNATINGYTLGNDGAWIGR